MTTAYTKTGKQICRHFSKLPGGSKETRTGRAKSHYSCSEFYLVILKIFYSIDYTILDCIFSYELQTYFILDVLVYKSHPVLDSEVG